MSNNATKEEIERFFCILLELNNEILERKGKKSFSSKDTLYRRLMESGVKRLSVEEKIPYFSAMLLMIKAAQRKLRLMSEEAHVKTI